MRPARMRRSLQPHHPSSLAQRHHLPHIEAAFTELGYRRADLRRVVLTPLHGDHTGAAADVRAWGDVEILAHESEAPVTRGERPGAEYELTEGEGRCTRNCGNRKCRRCRHARRAGSCGRATPSPARRK